MNAPARAVQPFVLLTLVCASFLAFGGGARADIIFQNNTNFILPGGLFNYVPFEDDGTPNRPLGNHLGETITFGGTARSLGTVELAAANVTGGPLTYTLDIYAGANPNTGALLGSASAVVSPTVLAMPIFSFNGLLLPDTVTFVVSSNHPGSGFLETGPASSNIAPTIGSGPNSLWYGFGPGTFTANSTWAIDDGAVTNFLVVQFDTTSVVPEPATLSLFGIGLLGSIATCMRRGHREPTASR
jgi:hypothetical protein